MLRMMTLVLFVVLSVISTGFAAEGTAVTVPEILPHDAFLRQQQGALLVDVREDGERAEGMAQGALGVPMAALQASPAAYLPNRDAPVLLICRSGQRSKRVAASLLEQGYTQVYSVQGGTLRWQKDGLPMVIPER